MRKPQITITIPQGSSVRIDLQDSDGQFIVSYGDPEYAPAGQTHEALRIMADFPDSTGREGVVYEELYNDEHLDEVLQRDQIQILEELAVDAGLTRQVSLEQIIADSINPGAISELLPDNFGGVLGASTSAPTASPAQPGTPAANAAQNAVEGAPEAVPATPTPVLSAQGMEPMLKAPRDGTRIILIRATYEGAEYPEEREMATWSSALGRQFWVDEDQQTLGSDDDFLGWRKVTDQDREDFGL